MKLIIEEYGGALVYLMFGAGCAGILLKVLEIVSV